MTIWKFPLQLNDETVIPMPAGAKVLCVQMQGRTICAWAVVDEQAPKERRRFYIRGTGHPLGQAPIANYVGTVQIDGFVFHVFDGGSAEDSF